jgi:hypothetical protein
MIVTFCNYELYFYSKHGEAGRCTRSVKNVNFWWTPVDWNCFSMADFKRLFFGNVL